MKILMTHPHDIYSTEEPWTVRITYLAGEFVNRGHEVKLVYFHLPPRERGKVKDVRYPFETIAFNRSNWAIWKNIFKMHKLAAWADILHFQKCFSYASLPSIIASYLRGKPVHYDWDDWELRIYEFGPPSRIVGFYLNVLEKTVPKLVDTISVSSQHIHDMARKQGIPDERIFDAHVGADLKKFNPLVKSKIRQEYNIQGPLVLYVGQLHGAQYAELFLKAAKVVGSSTPDATFMVVGGGRDLDRLKKVAEELELRGLIFTGPVEHDNVPRYMAAADVAVACFEDNDITRCKSPLKIVEYMAMGKAIVASRVGEVSKMLEGCGVLVKASDFNALAGGIKELLADATLRRKLGEKARKAAEEEYNWSVTADNLLSAYECSLKR